MNRTWGLIGLDNPIHYLNNAIKTSEVFHAYIFSGPDHSGKAALAVKFAQALNCLEKNSPCGKCEVCRRIFENIHPDIQTTKMENGKAEDRSKTGISVEQIREINHAASLPPYESHYRLFIIEDADTMSPSGANALLKTLEEPADHLVFILVTSNITGIPDTVRSRCQTLNFGSASEADIIQLLISDYDTAPDQAELLSRLCEGRVGWAVTACSDDSILQGRESDLAAFIDLLESDYKSRFDTANQLAIRMNSGRREVYQILDHWVSFCRDILLCKLNIANMVVNITFISKAKELAEIIELDSIRLMIQSIVKFRTYLGFNSNPKLTLEVLMLGLPFPGGFNYRHA